VEYPCLLCVAGSVDFLEKRQSSLIHSSAWGVKTSCSFCVVYSVDFFDTVEANLKVKCQAPSKTFCSFTQVSSTRKYNPVILFCIASLIVVSNPLFHDTVDIRI
jgi:hypothetical protein